MPGKVYDAVVIGSGAVGGWAAKELAEGGMEIAVLEAGRHLDPDKDFAEHTWPYELPFRGFSQPGIMLREQRSVSDFANEYNRHLFVKDGECPYTFPKDKPFMWVRSRQVGGRSIVWGRQSYRYSNYDFKAASHDGYGEDWPISYEDLEPYYDKVEEHIGVSGTEEGLPQLPDSKFLPGMAPDLRGTGIQKGGGRLRRPAAHHRPHSHPYQGPQGPPGLPLVRALLARLRDRFLLQQPGFDLTRRATDRADDADPERGGP